MKMKALTSIIVLEVILIIPQSSNAQVLISLLFGDALNSEKIEFGLAGGLNRSYLNDLPEAKGLNNFNLGFYFHINLKNSSYLSTGVMVKSTVGAKGMPTYQIGDEDFDSLYVDGSLTKKINCFYVPIMYQQRFNNRWYIEGGIVPGLRTKAKDIFNTEVLDGDLEYVLDVKDQYTRLDFGLMGGIGYKLKKQIESTAVGVSYYYGLVNVSKLPDTTMKNSSIYFYVKIPIGAGAKVQNVD
jgi:hypothetical protein